MTPKLTFVLGGCRSGKSRYALSLAERAAGEPRVYVATCEPKDEEMRLRIAQHQAERAAGWITEEAPLQVAAAVERHRRSAAVILVDCLTLWISNLMLAPGGAPDPAAAADHLVEVLSAEGCPVVVVSNEVGAGIVPENRLARRYRDAVGAVNQRMAACADSVVWMVAGIPVAVKETVGR